MEKADQDLLLEIAQTDKTLNKLCQQHSKLEKQVENFERYAGYSTTARLRQQQLKKEKLRMKEAIVSILNSYREEMPKVGNG